MPLSRALERELRSRLEDEASRYDQCLEVTTLALRHCVAKSGWVYPEELHMRVNSRLKGLARIKEKVDRYGPRDVASFEELDKVISDIVGARVILDHPYQAMEIVRWIKEESSWDIGHIDDSVRVTGYRSAHIDVASDTTHHKCVPCEIQVRTLLQHAWATWSHPLYERYRADLDAIPPLVKNLMKQLSDLLNSCDEMAQELHQHALQLGGNYDE